MRQRIVVTIAVIAVVFLIGSQINLRGSDPFFTQDDNTVSKPENVEPQSLSTTTQEPTLKANMLVENKLNSVYQIWVPSFYDSNNDGTGDLRGVIEKFDYIKALSVNTVLLSPIFESPSFHGYDPTNFFKVDADLGNLEDFKKLVSLFEQSNIKLLLDLPLNHTSEYHPWFKSSLNSEEGFKDFYVWRTELPTGYGLPWSEEENNYAVWHSKPEREGWYYGVFGYGNPDLNYANPAVVQKIKSVLKHWLALGVDGYRIDAARYLAEEGPYPLQADTKLNYGILTDLVTYSKTINPDVLFIGETFTDIASSMPYLSDGNLDAIFNFEYFNSVRSIYEDEAILTSLEQGEFNAKQALFDIFQNISPKIDTNKSLYIFLNNHDIGRLSEKAEVQKILATLTILSPYDMALYYGEELGLNQFNQHGAMYVRGLMPWNSDLASYGGFNQGHQPWVDDRNRFPWLNELEPWAQTHLSSLTATVSSAEHNADSVLTHYQQLLKLKLSDSVFSHSGSLELLPSSDSVWFVKYSNSQGERWIIQNLNPSSPQKLILPNELQVESFDVVSQVYLDNIAELELAAAQTLILSTSPNYK
ncbi:hypothetical protein C2869_05425 [Saccharobesus litoralis]|uniref:Glycosyl hydrolase family 13 catalytic domain-containing protein n=1 Tax=Saccharobesus litoralis TaxID=2172099 RepID=A0A2S0VNX3_9ALTE|nr:alpha-amylase family glycosyl hydrolase [Saccharobesus litoralis]AWB65917.1 hypothetical protein C2869_05425 [Saccharobesus litoralis]